MSPNGTFVFIYVGSEGFEPPKVQDRLIYSQLRLTAPPTTHAYCNHIQHFALRKKNAKHKMLYTILSRRTDSNR